MHKLTTHLSTQRALWYFWSGQFCTIPPLLCLLLQGEGGRGGGSVLRLTSSSTHILSKLQGSSEMNNWRLYLAYWNCFLSSVAKDSKDGHGLKLEKTGPTLSSFNAMPAKMTKNYFGQCFLIHFSVWYFLHNFTGAFCVWVNALSNDFSTELT